MSTKVFCDECGRGLPNNTPTHSLGVQGKAVVGYVDLQVYKYDVSQRRTDGRPDLCLPCLKSLIAAGTKR